MAQLCASLAPAMTTLIRNHAIQGCTAGLKYIYASSHLSYDSESIPIIIYCETCHLNNQ